MNVMLFKILKKIGFYEINTRTIFRKIATSKDGKTFKKIKRKIKLMILKMLNIDY